MAITVGRPALEALSAFATLWVCKLVHKVVDTMRYNTSEALSARVHLQYASLICMSMANEAVLHGPGTCPDLDLGSGPEVRQVPDFRAGPGPCSQI